MSNPCGKSIYVCPQQNAQIRSAYDQLKRLRLQPGDILLMPEGTPFEHAQSLQAACSKHLRFNVPIAIGDISTAHGQDLLALRESVKAGPLGLEISPRQTGKTNRLIIKAREYLADGVKVRVVCSKGLESFFKAQLPGAHVYRDLQKLPDDCDPGDGVWLYDEFDWLTSAVVRSNAYYYSSPRFTRKLGSNPGDDLLLQLLHAKGGHFERYYWSSDMADLLHEARLVHTPEEFRRLYLGEFFE